jgi:WD40 repeat protein
LSVALTHDGRRLVTAPRDGIATLWDTANGKILQVFDEHTTGAMALSHDGKHVVTGVADGRAILWETASGRKLQTFQKRVSR